MFANIEQCKWAGGRVISINLRYGDVGRLADYYLPVHPGTDGALYLAWIHVIIEEELYDKEFVENWCIGFDDLKEAVKEYIPEKAAEIYWVPADLIAERHTYMQRIHHRASSLCKLMMVKPRMASGCSVPLPCSKP